jgi:hypothetical protein
MLRWGQLLFTPCLNLPFKVLDKPAFTSLTALATAAMLDEL